MRNESKLHFHARMLADTTRIQAYQSAICQVVRPGDVVVDLGTGTGILAFFAVRAGAKRVIGIDQDAFILRKARILAQDNHFSDRVEFRHANILELTEFDTPVDVVMSELIGNEGIEERIFSIHKHFLQLLPRPVRTILPDVLRLHAACFQIPQIRERIESVRTAGGLQMHRLANALYHAHVLMPLPVDMASSPALLYEGRPGIDIIPESFSCTWDFSEPQTIDGVGLWFSSQLAPNIELTNDPREKSTSWTQCFFPILLSQPVIGRVRFDLWPRTLGGVPHWKWRFRTSDVDFTGDPDTLDEPDSVTEWLDHWNIVYPSEKT
mgnify:CR=1 FL=1